MKLDASKLIAETFILLKKNSLVKPFGKADFDKSKCDCDQVFVLNITVAKWNLRPTNYRYFWGCHNDQCIGTRLNLKDKCISQWWQWWQLYFIHAVCILKGTFAFSQWKHVPNSLFSYQKQSFFHKTTYCIMLLVISIRSPSGIYVVDIFFNHLLYARQEYKNYFAYFGFNLV